MSDGSMRGTKLANVPTVSAAGLSAQLGVTPDGKVRQATPVNVPGKSAYQSAVDGGYSGTESQWLASLVGASAYATAVGLGYVGTSAQWIASLTGAPGANGSAVLNGTSNPGAGVGSNGDFFINTAAVTLFGPKAAGAWPSGVSLKGADAEAPQRQIVAVQSGVTTGRITVTWAMPFGAGVVPIVEALPVKPTGATNSYNAALYGDPTNTGCVIEVNVVPPSITLPTLALSLLGLVLSLFQGAPVGTKVHVTARAP